MFDKKEKVMLGGFAQTIHIRGASETLPVLLFLHGGPGVPNRHVVMKAHRDLMEDFLVVAWDQRGSGGSYRGIDPATLTLEQMVEDARQLVEYLCTTLHKGKIFIIGGSWGTELGTYLVARYPQHIAGYLGYGQAVNGTQNEELSYRFAYEAAQKAQDTEAMRELERVGPPVAGQYHPVFEGLMTQRRIMNRYGGSNLKKEGYFTGTVVPVLTSAEYTLADKIGYVKGYKLVLSSLWPTMMKYDFPHECSTFACPYYIFQGRLDNTTPSALVQDYYDGITAPDKDLIWFEHSAHGPISEEPEKFKRLLREKFLPIARQLDEAPSKATNID